MSNKERFDNIVGQLDRYGCPSEPVLLLLEAVTNLNDDVCNMRLLEQSLAQIQSALAEFTPADTSQGEQGKVKLTYLVGYSHARGTGRCIETFNREPTPECIRALENQIELRSGISSVGITSISRIGNSDE